MILTYYLFAQDRIEEGLAHFDKIERKEVREKLQYDYFAVNAAFYRLEIDKAEKIAKTYENYSIDRWKKLFAEALAHVSEAKAVLDPKVVDEERGINRWISWLTPSPVSPLNLWTTRFV